MVRALERASSPSRRRRGIIRGRSGPCGDGRLVPERGWNFYSLVATIEAERHARDNPAIPNWLVDEYRSAWAELLSLALDELRTTRDPYVVQTGLAVISLAKGLTKLGFLISGLDESELDEFLDESAAWQEHYDADRIPRIAER